MSKLIEHRIKASPAQLKKLMTGGAVTLKPENFDPSSRHILRVKPNTSRRIGTAARKSKGIRLMLKPDEDIMEADDVIEGGKVSLKKVGKDLKKTFGSRKAIKTYKEIGKEVLPIAKGIADAGIDAGSMALATYMGNPALAPVLAGTAKVSLDRGYSELGKQVGLDPDTPVPYLDTPEAVQAAAMTSAEKNIRKRTKGRVRDASLAALSGDYATAQALGTDYAIDRKLSGVEQKIAKKAARGEYTDIKDLATDYAAEKLAEATQVAPDMGSYEEHQDEIQSLMLGRGIKVSKSRGGLKIGGASAYQTPAYERGLQGAMTGGSITGVQTAGYDMRGITPATAPSSIIQLGSPYQRLQSASMSPFIAASPQLANKPISSVATLGSGFRPAGRYGGSFMPAGRYGGSFMPAG